jgi:hypothetical protein
MLLKSVTKKGAPVPMTPRECAPFAVVSGVKAMNTNDMIYWADPKTVEITSFSASDDEKGEWKAWAEGTVLIGRTSVSNDRFFVPRPNAFSVRYASSKDPLGLPDISVEAFECKPVETNPSNNVGPVDRTNAPVAVAGEISAQSAQPTKGGQPRSKYRQG